MSQSIYVLIAEDDDYCTNEVIGVFSSKSEAEAAIPKTKALAKSQWELYQAYEKKREDYLKRFTPDKVFPPGLAFPDGCILYKEAQYDEARKACGPVPKLVRTADVYRIEQFILDEIGAGPISKDEVKQKDPR